jgi:hypothetical protein
MNNFDEPRWKNVKFGITYKLKEEFCIKLINRTFHEGSIFF